MASDVRFMKKKITTGEIEADLDNLCILVHYELEISILDDSGSQIMTEAKKDVKRIRLQSLNENSNIPLLAEEIISKCKLIHESKKPIVQALLTQLRESGMKNPKRKWGALSDDIKSATIGNDGMKGVDIGEPSMKDLDKYVEMLYETHDSKVKATACVLELARSQDNLEELLSDETLFGVLSRTLREEGTKDSQLGMNILFTFFCFSNFSQFHQFISQHQVGAACMRIIEVELEKQSRFEQEIAKRKEEGTSSKRIDALKKKQEGLQKNQEQILSVAFHLLLNLAEDITLERKMRRKNVVNRLIQVLDWQSEDLLVVVLTFLKKLSIFKENKNQIARSADRIIPKIARFIQHPNEGLMVTAMKLLINLSFDSDIQRSMAKCGLIPLLVALIPTENFRADALKLLYHLSLDKKNKPLFTSTDMIPMILKLTLETPANQFVPKEVAALAVNLGMNKENAEIMATDGLGLLMARVKKTKDPFLMKMIKTITGHGGKTVEKFGHYIPELINLGKKSKDDDFLAEVLAALGNCNAPNSGWATAIQDSNILAFLSARMVPKSNDNDMILKCIVLVGTLIEDKKCVQLIVASNIISLLIEALLRLQEDDNIVIQTVYVLFKLLQHKESRIYLLNETQLVHYLSHLLFDSNREIRNMSSLALDVVMEYDKEAAKAIREKKFQAHNSVWCEVTGQEDKSLGYHTEGCEDDWCMEDMYAHPDRQDHCHNMQWSNLHFHEEDV